MHEAALGTRMLESGQKANTPRLQRRFVMVFVASSCLCQGGGKKERQNRKAWIGTGRCGESIGGDNGRLLIRWPKSDRRGGAVLSLQIFCLWVRTSGSSRQTIIAISTIAILDDVTISPIAEEARNKRRNRKARKKKHTQQIMGGANREGALSVLLLDGRA